MRFLQQTHEKIELIECFSNIGVHYTSLLPIKIRTKPCIMILKRKPNAVLLKRFFDADEPEEDANFEEIALKDLEVEEAGLEVDELEEVAKEPPKLIRKKRLRSTTSNPRLKIKEIIEAEKLEALNYLQQAQINAEAEDVPSEELASEEQNPSLESNELPDREPGSGIKNNIKRIISQEKTKELLSELDLSAFCDLNQMDTKECLKKILNEMDD